MEEWRVNDLSDPSANGEAVENGGAEDYHHLTDTNSDNRRSYAFWVWALADFIDQGAPGVSIDFGPASRFLLNVRGNSGLHFCWRAAVKEGNQWYLSEAFGYALGTWQLVNPGGGNWAPYDPAANLQAIRGAIGNANAGGGSAGMSFEPRLFKDIAAVGLYAESTDLNGANDRTFQWTQFTVTARMRTSGSALIVR